MKVSVVVPVYNPGTYIEPCITSLLAQTMPAEDFEVIFVDDGSTDATPARLDDVAAEHANVRVIHQENSGWPGKPRNVGVAAARGEYVQFVDQDDSMWPRALELLFGIGARNHADIVIGKVTSDFRGVPHGVFRETVEHCTIRDHPLIDSLTPHKMFRKAFLDEHDISYPEGKRRLEDQLYMVRTYLAAETVSIVGDYPCYFYMARDDGKNAGSVSIEPAGYYTNLREILDVITDQVEPGELRDSLLRRFYRNEFLGRLKEPAILGWKPEYRRTLFEEVRRLGAEKMPDAVPDGMDVVPRVRSVMLRENRLEDLTGFAARLKDIHCRTSMSDVRWTEGRLDVHVSAAQWSGPDRPLLLSERDGRVWFDPELVGGCVAEPVTEITAELDDVRADVVIRNRRNNVEWFVPSELLATLVPSPEHGEHACRLEFAGTAHLDVLSLAGGHPLPRGTWDVSVRIHALGLVNRARLGAPEFIDATPVEPAIVGSPAHAVIALCTEFGNLTLDVNEHVRWVAGEVAARPPITAAAVAGKIGVPLPVVMGDGSRGWPVRITLVDDQIAGGPSFTLPARIENHGGVGLAVANLAGAQTHGPVRRLRPGRFNLFLHSGSRGLPPVLIGTMLIDRPSATARLAGLRRAVGRRLPAPLRRVLRRAR